MTETILFTPRTKEGTRLEMQVLKTDIPRGYKTTFEVVEASTGDIYKCQTASCDLPNCMCDAVIL